MSDTSTRSPLALAVNAGSSSLKFGLYAAEGPALWAGQVQGLEPGGKPSLQLDGRSLPWQPGPERAGTGAAVDALDQALAQLAWLLQRDGLHPAVVAHRIVHGGERCVAPCLLDADTLAYLHTLDSLAPLHQAHNLAGVEAFGRWLPEVPQIGCFDTAFHASIEPVERLLPIDQGLSAQMPELRRYGFHGLSYDHLSRTLQGLTPRASGRAVLAHLGNGASVCAIRGGRSVATSMGFSALDGLMMGTRSGSLDPGVLLHLLQAGWDAARIERLLYRESGLKGVSGLSADMRTLRRSSSAQAQQAIALFTHRLRREVGALIAVLGGIELLAFSGGIGEHDAQLRADLAQSLAFTGLRLDSQANAAACGDACLPVHAANSTVEVWVVPTDEGRVAARAALGWLAQQGC